MRELHVACGQFAADLQHPAKNIEVMKSQMAEAAKRGCEIILFPEMSLTGYMSPEELMPLAETRDGSSIRKIGEAAQRSQIAVVFGFPEIDSATGFYHNSFVFIDEAGATVGLYRKIHLWDTEAAWAEPGVSVEVFDFADTKWTGWICYDTRFPELARLGFLGGAEVGLVPTAWLGPFDEWDLCLRARAVDNSMFVLGSDLINRHPELKCYGLSLIVGPHGEVLARATPERDCVIDAVLDPNLLTEQRNRVPVLRDRKPEVYGRLSDVAQA